jgi:hypothetical protein
LRVSVVARKMLNSCVLSTDTPVTGVSVIESHTPPTPHSRGVGRQCSINQCFISKYRHLSKKKENIVFYSYSSSLTCDLVAINHAAGILTLRSKLTCSLLHSHRLRTDSVCLFCDISGKSLAFSFCLANFALAHHAGSPCG